MFRTIVVFPRAVCERCGHQHKCSAVPTHPSRSVERPRGQIPTRRVSQTGTCEFQIAKKTQRQLGSFRTWKFGCVSSLEVSNDGALRAYSGRSCHFPAKPPAHTSWHLESGHGSLPFHSFAQAPPASATGALPACGSPKVHHTKR